MTKQTSTLSILGKRVKVTLTGHRYVGQKATIVKESKKNYSIKVDGVKTPQVLPKEHVKGYQGRRPKVQ